MVLLSRVTMLIMCTLADILLYIAAAGTMSFDELVNEGTMLSEHSLQPVTDSHARLADKV